MAALELITDIGPAVIAIRGQVENLLMDENEMVRRAAAAALAGIGSSTTESKP